MAVRKPLVIINGQKQELPAGDSVDVSYNGGTDPIIASFSGAVVAATGTSRYYHPSTTTITSAYMSLGVASSSGSVTVDVNLNGTTILAGDLTLAASAYKSTPVTLSQAITSSDYLTIDVTGAGTGAADLTVYLVVDAMSGSSYSGTIITAKLTAGGSNGSMTFTNGFLTSQTAAT